MTIKSLVAVKQLTAAISLMGLPLLPATVWANDAQYERVPDSAAAQQATTVQSTTVQSTTAPASAAPASAAQTLTPSSADPAETSAQWAQWLMLSVSALPSQQSLTYRAEAAGYQRLSDSQSRYLPELNMSFEDRDSSTYSFGVSQTLDWSGKRTAQSALAKGREAGEILAIEQAREQALADALTAQVDFTAAEQRLALAQQQQAGWAQLRAIAQQRLRAGDLQPLDAQLAYLTQAQWLPELAAQRANQQSATARLSQALNTQSPSFNLPSLRSWAALGKSASMDESIQTLAQQSPSVLAAHQVWQQAKRVEVLADHERNVDPTLGLSANREGDEDYLSLDISLPLSLNPRRSAALKAAQSRSLELEVRWRDSVRLASSELESKLETARVQQSFWLQWQDLTDGRGAKSAHLLAEKFGSGDMSTRDYVFGMQQRNDALVAGIELARQAQRSWVAWLLSSQQIEGWLQQLAQAPITNNESSALDNGVSGQPPITSAAPILSAEERSAAQRAASVKEYQ